ncbi:MAG: acyltransferase [Lachnospiraceae bacterium]|nr:acyltransferase [Lachnospiraceae bacterium]
MKEAKTNNIYLWKILFTYMIIAFHYPMTLSFLYEKGCTWGWYIAVEFFFVVSGALLYKNMSVYSDRYKGAWQYNLHRYKNIWPKYLMAFVCVFVAIVIKEGYGFKEIYRKLLDSILEIFMLQGIGLNRDWDYINPTLWYISILIIAGYVIYWFLANHKDTFIKIIVPICLVIGYSYLYRYVGSLDAVVKTEGFYGNQALIRGFLDMCLGIYAMEFSKFLYNRFERRWWLRIIEVVLVALVVVLSLTDGHSTNDFAFLIMIFVIVAIGFIPRKRVAFDSFIKLWASITLNIYLIHELFRTYIMDLIFPNLTYGELHVVPSIVYFVLVTLAAIVMELIWKGVLSLVRRNDKARLS